MKYGISPPGCQYPMEQTAFNAYAYNQQRLENFINYLASTDDPNDFDNQSAAALAANLNIGSLTAQERNYIESEVAKRHVWR